MICSLMTDGGNSGGGDGGGGYRGGGGGDGDYDDGENNVGELVEFFNVLLLYLSGRVKCGIIIYKHYVQRKPWLDNNPRRRGRSDTNITSSSSTVSIYRKIPADGGYFWEVPSLDTCCSALH